MLGNLKDKLRSEMDVFDFDDAKDEAVNNSITDFVDTLEAIKEGDYKKASGIISYLKDSLDDLDTALKKLFI